MGWPFIIIGAIIIVGTSAIMHLKHHDKQDKFGDQWWFNIPLTELMQYAMSSIMGLSLLWTGFLLVMGRH